MANDTKPESPYASSGVDNSNGENDAPKSKWVLTAGERSVGLALDTLQAAIFDAYTVFVEQKRDGGGPRGSESERREVALCGISELLELSPLNAYGAVHLETLELVLSYWLQLVTREDGGECAPWPEAVR